MIYYIFAYNLYSRGMDTLPVELLHEIASNDIGAYRALFAMRSFVESLKPMMMIEYRIKFGYSVQITKDRIEWYFNGLRHRVDGPAIEYADGNKEWYQNGEKHRIDGAAIEHVDGTKKWYLNGKLHRVDGPAIEFSSGEKGWYKGWYLNGKLHRVDGPAIENRYCLEWWVDGKFIRSE